jgi:hypothetical protein
MQVYRDDQFIQRRAKIGRYANLGGMGILLFGLIVNLSMQAEGLLLSMLALIVGFAMYQVGMYYTLRFGRPDRPDQILQKSLKGFDHRYTLFQYTGPAGNVLVTPNACLVFAIKMQSKGIQYRGGKWKHIVGWQKFFLWLAGDSLGNPSREAVGEVDTLQRYLAKKLPGVEIPLQPVIVFGNPNAEVEAGECPMPALHYKKLKDWLRGPGKSGNLSAGARDQLIELLSPPSAVVESADDEEEESEEA